VSACAPPTTAMLPSRGAVMRRAEHENFTVASAVLGRRRQRHLMAIYGFARLVDDTGDEVAGDRAALLDLIEGELDSIYAGERPGHAVMSTLADTVWACGLPASPFRRLLEANRLDQLVTRYETFDQLLCYCQLSAAPVGELVLGVFHAATPERTLLSDRICAGLQITEHLQDVGEDYARGRIYLPLEDLARFGGTESDLPAWLETSAGHALIAFEARRAHSLLSDGAPLARTLPVRPRIAVAGFLAGGRTALEALGRAGDPVLVADRVRRRRGFAARARRRRGFPVAFMKAAMGQ
jgi:squalene synthase HpnC